MKPSYIQIPRKRRTLACYSLLVGRKIIFMLNLQQNRKNALDKILEIFVNCKQSTHQVTFLFTNEKSYFFHFYPTDLVNTKTTIPSGSVNSARYIPQRFAFWKFNHYSSGDILQIAVIIR